MHHVLFPAFFNEVAHLLDQGGDALPGNCRDGQVGLPFQVGTCSLFGREEVDFRSDGEGRFFEEIGRKALQFFPKDLQVFPGGRAADVDQEEEGPGTFDVAEEPEPERPALVPGTWQAP